jgi:CBS domain-containing protein
LDWVKVETVMTTKVIRVEPESSVAEVLKKLHAYRISCVVVCEGDIPVGMVSERDAVGFAFKQLTGNPKLPLVARELMSSSLVSIESFATLERALELTAEHQIRRLPVVDSDGRLVGLVTQSDLLRAARL